MVYNIGGDIILKLAVFQAIIAVVAVLNSVFHDTYDMIQYLLVNNLIK